MTNPKDEAILDMMADEIEVSNEPFPLDFIEKQKRNKADSHEKQ